MFTLQAERESIFIENSRLNFDLSSRTSYYERAEEATFQQFIGFDFHKIVSLDNKDFGHFVLQPYLNRIDNGQQTPAHFDDSHDWEVIFRTLTFTYTGLGPGKPWIKAGHFELPFGLDHRKDTNGNLHQYSIAKATGLKIDWGLSIGQEYENWYYEFAVTRGSGVKFRNRQDPHAFTGRIAHDSDTWSAGFSFFQGDILKGKKTVKFETIAFDYEYYYKTFGFLAEIYSGKQNEKRVYGALLEVNWTSHNQDLNLYKQFLIRDQDDSSTQASLVVGAEYYLTRTLSISSQFSFPFSEYNGLKRENIFEFQFRYKF